MSLRASRHHRRSGRGSKEDGFRKKEKNLKGDKKFDKGGKMSSKGGSLSAIYPGRDREMKEFSGYGCRGGFSRMTKKGRVRQKLSSRGKYVSVKIGPVQVVSSEQVQAVYNAMRRDDRMKYFL
ncbi:hypothetical protein Scep_018196 [Stephania cephalantha]|uniref:Uncharacterized protein n=1 Tax=Stephania cephalantha TaxID=152367 RepID=A0AAP0IQY3_9MAGN